jgi:hypothetical protein
MSVKTGEKIVVTERKNGERGSVKPIRKKRAVRPEMTSFNERSFVKLVEYRERIVF